MINLQAGSPEVSTFKGNSTHEEKAFEKMLCAIFGREYNIIDGAELLRITQLAAKYGCLSAVSSSLWGPINTSPGLVPSIQNSPCQVLFAAYKLRHKHLFREAFVYVLGPESAPRYTKLTDPTLKSMAKLVHGKFQSKLLVAHQALLNIHAHPKEYSALVSQHLIELATESIGPNNKVLTPMYFRKCFELACENKVAEKEIEDILSSFMKSKLFLDKTGATAGKRKLKDSFLCFEPTNIPWNETETDF